MTRAPTRYEMLDWLDKDIAKWISFASSGPNPMLVAIRDELSRATPSAWQPIESAPRDGTKVDLWVNRQVGLSAGPGRLPDCWFYNGKWYVYDDHGDDMARSEVHHATHWMPTPTPPSEGER